MNDKINVQIAKSLYVLLGLETNFGNMGHSHQDSFRGPWLEVVCFEKDRDNFNILKKQQEEMLKEYDQIMEDNKTDPYMIEEMLGIVYREINALQRPAFEVLAQLVIEFSWKSPVEADISLIVELSSSGARLQCASSNWHEDFCKKKGEERLKWYQAVFEAFAVFLKDRQV